MNEIDLSLNIRAYRTPVTMCGDRIELYGFQSSLVAKPLKMDETERFARTEPFCILEKEKAQVLMDDLWETGLRPSEGTGSAGSLKATQNHLADLKKILFHKLGIKD